MHRLFNSQLKQSHFLQILLLFGYDEEVACLLTKDKIVTPTKRWHSNLPQPFSQVAAAARGTSQCSDQCPTPDSPFQEILAWYQVTVVTANYRRCHFIHNFCTALSIQLWVQNQPSAISSPGSGIHPRHAQRGEKHRVTRNTGTKPVKCNMLLCIGKVLYESLTGRQKTQKGHICGKHMSKSH